MTREQPNPTPSNKNNAVRITYYIQSPANTIRSNQKIKPQQFPGKAQPRRKCGYDRRAELLSYANRLRNAESSSSSNQKKKWKWCTTPAKFPVLFLQICGGIKGGRWKYEQMPSEEKMNGRRKKSTRKIASRICKKIKCILKGLSFGRRKA